MPLYITVQGLFIISYFNTSNKMKGLLGLTLTVLLFTSCGKNSYLSNDQVILRTSEATIKNDDKLTRVFPVEFHLTSFQTIGISGTWYMNKQTPWNSPNINTQQWFQGQELEPFYDSTVIYASHYNPEDNGDGGIGYFQDGQIDIHLTKIGESSGVVNGQVVTTQTGTWALGPKNRIYGVFGEIYSAGAGNYTYTYTPQSPLYYYVDGIAYPYGETKREVHLKGKLK